MKHDLRLYAGCIGGASSIPHLERMLQDIGFQHIRIRPKDDGQHFIRNRVEDRHLEDYIVSATIKAVKPTI